MEQPTENSSPVGEGGEVSEVAQDPPRRVRATSAVLVAIAENVAEPKVSLGDVVDQLGERSFGMLLLVLGLCGWVPLWPPGVATIFGIGIGLVAVQMALGRSQPWLPKILTSRRLSRERFVAVTRRIVPVLRRCESFARPRLPALTRSTAERLIGLYVVLLGGVVCVPLPMTNAFPALSVAVIAIGLIERDGIAVLAGGLFGVLSVVFLFAFWSGAYVGLASIFGVSS
jgi:hypothetical protein